MTTPAAEGTHVVVEDEKFFEEDDSFALSAKLAEEVAQSAAAGHIEAEPEFGYAAR